MEVSGWYCDFYNNIIISIAMFLPRYLIFYLSLKSCPSLNLLHLHTLLPCCFNLIKIFKLNS